MHRTTARTTAGGSVAQNTPQNTPRKPGLLINRNYALLWTAQAVSVIGDFAFSTTLAVWVFILAGGQAWAPLAVTGVYVATALPMVLVGPLAGVFVDRWNKRRTMLTMDALRAVLVAALIPVTGVVPLNALAALPVVGDAIGGILIGGQLPLEWRLGAIYAVVFVVNGAEQFFIPSRTALIGDIVSDPYRGRAMGLGQASVSLAMMLGTLVAPPLVVSFGAQWTLAFDALTFVVSYLAIRAIRPPAASSSVVAGERGHVGREFAAGVRFFARSRVLMTVLIGGVVIMSGAGALNALDIFFVTGNLHTELSLYGVLTAVTGAGMLVGSMVAALFSHKLGYARTVWLSLFGMGLLLLVYARLTSFGPAVVAMTVLGVLQAGVNVPIGPLLLSVTPRTLVGRTSALLNLALTVSSLAGTAVAGYLAGTTLSGFSARVLGFTFGPIDTIFTAAGVLALVGATYCAFNLRAKTIARERVDEPDPSGGTPGEERTGETGAGSDRAQDRQAVAAR